ncbi:MAG TPA: TRAP transporter large permease, partial [Candidatus Methylomirabilis sp.]|nr:TRAP transporter large permease [Candidatus Methylomirabilis sp.]
MLWLFVIMLVLFALSTPIGWSMAIAAAMYMALGPHIPLQGMVQRMIGGIDTFPLLAIPFFILAGNLMNTGGITDRLVTFAKALVGHIIGGLAHVVVVTNMIMAGMSGSGVADAAGTGTVLIPAMKKAGYGVPFSAAIVGSAGTIGPIIPPSIPFVIYGSIAGASIGKLLLGGAVPGVLMGIMLMIFVYFIAKRRHYPREQRATWGDLGRATLQAIPPLGMPTIILGGIIGGVMTPTEAAAAGAAYAFVLGFFVYREIKLSHLSEIITESVMGTAAILIIMSAAQPFSWVLTYELAPVKVLALVESANLAQWQLYLLINVAMLILGCFMEG